MKLLTNLFIIIILFITSCGQGSPGPVDVQIVLNEDHIEFHAVRLGSQSLDYAILNRKYYYNELRDSYITHVKDQDNHVRIVISLSFDDYFSNLSTNSMPPKPLPTGEAFPGISRYLSGGDGVGNGRVSGTFAYLEKGKAAAFYQNEERIAFYYPYKLYLEANRVISSRLNASSRKGYISLLGGPEDPNNPNSNNGIFFVIPKPGIK